MKLKVRVHGRHPWFYRKMIQRPAERIPAGSAVRVVDRAGKPVGTGFYNSRTDLALRMLDRARVDDPDAFLLDRLDAAIHLRHEVLGLPEVTNGYRIVHSEGDGFPGIVIDRLGDAIVAQLFSLCMQQRAEPIGERLLERFPGSRMVLTVDETAKSREGMETPPRGKPFVVDVEEHGLHYAVRPGQDHKTGFFADQRDARMRVRELARGRTVLDLCCNSGGFALNASVGGAKRVVGFDLDEGVVAQAAENAKRNRRDVRFEHGDAFDVLRDAKDGAYDLIVLDPPKWIRGKEEVEVGERRYQDLNQLAFRKVARGGIVVTCSCSGALGEPRFLSILTEAAAIARRDARILHVGGAGPDHPVALECPQTRYLKVATLAF
ncbi:MAG: class I SAM-dependent rRNA methyltransferase [Planctomycetes bacterium]|nr:class I SAM-dependent rRNA methyltransferase [Planctomycetota bacterium]